MKGIVFTELIEMVEENFSPDLADELIDRADLTSGGAYTSVGTYDHRELQRIVVELSKATATPIPDLLNKFGHHLFKKFLQGFPDFFEGTEDAFSMLERVDGHIHVEVRKLYPDAELPKFTTRRVDNAHFEMLYQSTRHLQDLAAGLIEACIHHYGGGVTIDRREQDEATLFLLAKA